MEPELKLITINGKKYQIDIEQAKKLNLLKEKDNRAKSWEEFIEKYRNYGYCYDKIKRRVIETAFPFCIEDQLTPHEAKAINAFSELIKLRRNWIGEWEPNWTEPKEYKYCICNELKESDIIELTVDYFIFLTKPLSFPTQQMAQEFLETFHDLIEDAKILI